MIVSTLASILLSVTPVEAGPWPQPADPEAELAVTAQGRDSAAARPQERDLVELARKAFACEDEHRGRMARIGRLIELYRERGDAEKVRVAMALRVRTAMGARDGSGVATGAAAERRAGQARAEQEALEAERAASARRQREQRESLAREKEQALRAERIQAERLQAERERAAREQAARQGGRPEQGRPPPPPPPASRGGAKPSRPQSGQGRPRSRGGR
jgi:hypothetical protein